MAENRATGDQWYQTSTFFKDNFPIKEEKVPDEVKTRWSELVPEEREEIREETEEAREVSERATSEMPKSQPSKSLSKKSVKNKKRIIPPVDPRLSRERDRSMPAPKKAFSSVNFTSTSSAASSSKTAETVEKGSQPIIVTDSLQLIRPLRAELKWKMRTNAMELEKRMEIRKEYGIKLEDAHCQKTPFQYLISYLKWEEYRLLLYQFFQSFFLPSFCNISCTFPLLFKYT
uniref:Uncharacterized protein n=1 Tax=Meloidogyne floridensis TaxID=298350 RepID=A0A915NMQ6_9BILA